MPNGTLSLSNDGIPTFSPPYPSGKNVFEDMKSVLIQYRVAASDIRHLIPDVLEIEDEPLMTCVFIHYGTSSVGSYEEYVLQAEVTFRGQQYNYNIALILDNESAIFAGREVFGYPKVFGKVHLQTATGTRLIQGTVERPVGTPIVQFEFVPEAKVESLPKSDRWQLNLRSIPSPVPAKSAPIRELVPIFMEMHVKSAWIGKGSVRFMSGSLLHPWADMKILRYEGASFTQISHAELRTGSEVFPL
ncbi:hypothetical protein C7974DRAFT_446105 [Boeremia exigua]|uniref:uncharacterized protein n=1 Tax=Boeremia exigua TaxID=749465 RepID=UPI001E8EC46C|nr:uncharacterized protein C7974DRAFT_446105 [Boeremia exigua]KAH6612170.1 hypothetical protein C7974DRAFT_446105 [Boeremia exigua]